MIKSNDIRFFDAEIILKIIHFHHFSHVLRPSKMTRNGPFWGLHNGHTGHSLGRGQSGIVVSKDLAAANGENCRFKVITNYKQ